MIEFIQKLKHSLSVHPWNNMTHPTHAKNHFIIGKYMWKMNKIFYFSSSCYIEYNKTFLMFNYPMWYCWIKQYFICAQCRFNNHPKGSIFFTNYGTEPDNRCKGCGEEI